MAYLTVTRVQPFSRRTHILIPTLARRPLTRLPVLPIRSQPPAPFSGGMLGTQATANRNADEHVRAHILKTRAIALTSISLVELGYRRDAAAFGAIAALLTHTLSPRESHRQRSDFVGGSFRADTSIFADAP